MMTVKEKIKNAIDGIHGGFSWVDTQEGHTYWQDVINIIKKIERGKKTEPIKPKKPKKWYNEEG